jgi:hypothetical protein
MPRVRTRTGAYGVHCFVSTYLFVIAFLRLFLEPAEFFGIQTAATGDTFAFTVLAVYLAE